MATYGKYLSLSSRTTNSITVTWSSMGESGNIVTDPAYNLELWQPNDLVGTNVYRERPSLDTRRWTFTNLIPNTQYEVKLYANRQTDRPVDYLTVRTETPAAPTPYAPTMTLSSSGTTVSVSGVAGAYTSYIQLYVNNSYKVTRYALPGESYSYSFSGSYNSTYTVLATPYNSDGVPGTQTSRTIITGSEPLPNPPPAPTNFNIYDQGETWASFAWNSVSTATSYAMEIWRGSSRVDYDHNITNRTKQFTGLSPGVDYQAKLYAINAGGNGTPTYLNFRLGYDRPANFSWTTIKANNRSYNRNSLGQLTNFMTAQELRNFQARINDFRKYKGLSEYTFTIPAPGQVFTASMYNQLRTAISSMNPPTSLPSVGSSGSGDTVNRLNGLVSSLNSIS